MTQLPAEHETCGIFLMHEVLNVFTYYALQYFDVWLRDVTVDWDKQ